MCISLCSSDSRLASSMALPSSTTSMLSPTSSASRISLLTGIVIWRCHWSMCPLAMAGSLPGFFGFFSGGKVNFGMLCAHPPVKGLILFVGLLFLFHRYSKCPFFILNPTQHVEEIVPLPDRERQVFDFDEVFNQVNCLAL